MRRLMILLIGTWFALMLCYRPADAQSNPDKLIVRASQFIHAQKEETVRIIAKRFKFNDKHSQASWRYFLSNNAIPKDGEVNAKGLDKVLQLLVEDGTLKAPPPRQDKYIDTTYLDEARRTAQ